MIFPEGTTSNNTGFLNLRRGAFDMGNPVKLCALKLDYLYFAPYLNMISVVDSMYLSFCQPIAWVRLEEIKGNYYPKNFEGWLQFSENAKEFMCKEFKMKNFNASMKTKMEFDRVSCPIDFKY